MSPLLLFAWTMLAFVSSQNAVLPSTKVGNLEIYNTEFTEEYKDDLIKCSTSQCEVVCDTINGCQGVTIDASAANTLKVKCTDDRAFSIDKYACRDTQIIAGAKISTQIDCSYIGSCSRAIFNVGNSETVNLNCAGQSSCTGSILNATLSTNVNIDCSFKSSCANTDIYCPLNTINTNTECNITCSDIWDSSCLQMDVFIENRTSNINLDCGSTGCGSHSFDQTYATQIYCGDSTESTNSYLEYINNKGWTCATDGCCPFYNDILECNTPICTIDCATMDCTNKLIDGTSATSSFTVNCAAAYGGCTDATIRCPNIPNVPCNINCQDANSCEGILISGTNTYSLDLKCNGNSACYGSYIYCPYNESGVCIVDCSSDEYVCNNMDIYAHNSYEYNYLNMKCPNSNDNYACYNTSFNCYYEYSDGTVVKKLTSLIFDDVTNEYECENQNETLYCCPWLSPTLNPTSTPTTIPTIVSGDDGNGMNQRAVFHAITASIIASIFILH